jgi:nicotinamidase-related amidase
MSPPPGALLVIIDPQKGFVDPDGTLARVHGDDIQPGLLALEQLRRFLRGRPPGVRVGLVRSEYVPGQFCDGRLDHPLANICVPDVNIDCHWADGIDPAGAEWIVTKHQADAMQTAEVRGRIDQARASGVPALWFAGFQLTTCVAATAAAAATAYRDLRMEVSVLLPLCGARASSFRPNGTGRSRVDQVLDDLRACGVSIVRDLK